MERRIDRIQQSTTYEYNGVKYSRLEDMPPEVREHFVDRDGNGLPDSIDRLMKGVPRSDVKVVTTQRSVTRTFDSDAASRLASMGELDLARAVVDAEPIDTVRCSACGYDLKGTAVGGKCPECGQEVTASIRRLSRPNPSHSWTIIVPLAKHVAWLLALIVVIIVALRWLRS